MPTREPRGNTEKRENNIGGIDEKDDEIDKNDEGKSVHKQNSNSQELSSNDLYTETGSSVHTHTI
jgi:hypothetical protein